MNDTNHTDQMIGEALTDDELAQVTGGTEGPGNPTDGTGKASPKLF